MKTIEGVVLKELVTHSDERGLSAGEDVGPPPRYPLLGRDRDDWQALWKWNVWETAGMNPAFRRPL